MKKIVTLVLSLMLLCACSSGGYSDVSNGDEILYKGPNQVSFTKSDLYKKMKNSSADTISSMILKSIAAHYDTIDFEELEKQAQEEIDFYKSIGYEPYIIQSYGTLDAYKDLYVSSMTVIELSKIYIEENFETMANENKPIKMQLASFSTEEDALKCIDDFNNGSTFDMAAVNNNSANAPQSTVYIDSDLSLDYEVKEYLNDTDGTGISTVIPHSTGTTNSDGTVTEDMTYYVLNVESRNAEEFHDEFVETMALSLETDTVVEHFFEKHEIKFFDQDLYELMSKEYEVLK